MRSHLETAARITDSAKPTSEVVEYAVTPREKPLRFLAFRRGAFATAHQKQRHDAAMQASEKRAKRIKKRHRTKNKTRIKKRGGSSSSVASAMHRVCRQLKRPFAPVSLSYRALSAADLGEQSGGKEHYLERSVYTDRRVAPRRSVGGTTTSAGSRSIVQNAPPFTLM